MENKSFLLNSNIELLDETDEAFASVSLNPSFQWCKIIVCDDLPNENKQKVPKEEFANLVATGINSPIKMAKGNISDGHMEAFGNPIGTIPHLKVNGNQVIALAALWKKERPDDVATLKQMYLSGKPPQVSWELSYTDSFIDESGVENLKNLSMNGLAIVGMPAYSGRTPIIAMASKLLEVEEITEELSEAAVWTTAYVNNLPDSCFLYISPGGSKDADAKTALRTLRHLPYKDSSGKIDLAHLRNALAHIPVTDIPQNVKDKLTAKAKKLLQGASAGKTEDNLDELEQLTADLVAAKAEIEAIKPEFDELRTYKANTEIEKALTAKFASIKDKFIKAGIEKDAEYFETNKEKLLSYTDDGLDFMIQEMVSFAANKTTAASKNPKTNIPALNGEPVSITETEIVKALRERTNKRDN